MLSWRLLGVMQQHGLLQEAILFFRLKGQVRSRLKLGQLGYMRDVGDAHMAANELPTAYKNAGRPLIEIHADLV